jgi:hypothetical protein
MDPHVASSRTRRLLWMTKTMVRAGWNDITAWTITKKDMRKACPNEPIPIALNATKPQNPNAKISHLGMNASRCLCDIV